MSGNSSLSTLSHVDPRDRGLALYDVAIRSLTEAVTVVEALDVHDLAEHLELLGRQAKDTEILARAAELRMRSEHKLGVMLRAAFERGEISKGGRPRKTPSGSEGVSTITLKEAGVDWKLSARAQKLAEKPEQLFEAVVRDAIEKIRAGRAIVIDPMKATNTAEKIVKRAARAAELAARQKALPDTVYGVVLEDPEWEYETWSEAGKDRAAENHYPTSPLEALKARDVGKIAAPDCVRYVWVTVPMLKQGIEYLETHGFTYKSHWVWDKLDVGTGHWNRNRHEILLVGTRGNPPAPAPGTQYPSVMAERAREHSRKPDWAYEMIEAYHPAFRKIELNARRRREGWDAWGFEAPEDHELQAAAPPAVAATPNAAGDVGEVSRPPSGPPSPALPLDTEIAGREPPTPTGEGAGAAGNELPAPASDISIERAFYDDLVLSARDLRGKHTRQSAEAILRAAYACEPIIPTRQLAEDLGHPVGTVLSWASRFGLTRLERRAVAGMATRFGADAHP